MLTLQIEPQVVTVHFNPSRYAHLMPIVEKRLRALFERLDCRLLGDWPEIYLYSDDVFQKFLGKFGPDFGIRACMEIFRSVYDIYSSAGLFMRDELEKFYFFLRFVSGLRSDSNGVDLSLLDEAAKILCFPRLCRPPSYGQLLYFCTFGRIIHLDYESAAVGKSSVDVSALDAESKLLTHAVEEWETCDQENCEFHLFVDRTYQETSGFPYDDWLEKWREPINPCFSAFWWGFDEFLSSMILIESPDEFDGRLAKLIDQARWYWFS